MTKNIGLDPGLDVTRLLSGLPEGSVVVDISSCDPEIFFENTRRIAEVIKDARNACVYSLTLMGSARPLMDPSPNLEELRYILKRQIRKAIGGSESVVICVTVNELCRDYADMKLGREALNQRMLKETKQLPCSLEEIFGEILKGILVFRILLDEEGKKADSTQFVGGMSVTGV